MKKHKKIFMLLILLFTVFSIKALGAQIIGEATNTDIAAFIDNKPISSYHVGGFTYIVAEELRAHGFSVDWNEGARSLSIKRDTIRQYGLMEEAGINILKSDLLAARKFYDIYSSDIKTYMGGKLIDGCSVDGVTLIKFRELSVYGDISYNERKRHAVCDILKKELLEAYAASEKQEIKISDNITYIGEVLEGKPNGIGMMHITETGYLSEYRGIVSDQLQAYFTADKISECVITELGYFKDGKKDGEVITTGEYIGQIVVNFVPMTVIDRIMNIEIIGSYTEGRENGLIMEISTNQYGEDIRLDYFSTDDIKNLEYYSVFDDDYIYGYKVLTVKAFDDIL